MRLLADGSAMVPATQLEGRNHNNPCMLALDREGRIWFSDPHHPVAASGPHLFPLLEHQSVLRLECGPRPQSHWHIERMTFDSAAPRGVALSPDGKTLYVAETDNRPGGTRELRAYSVLEDGTLGPYIVLHTFAQDRRGVHRGIEGMCVDSEGNIVACAGWRRSGPGPLVYVFAPSGAVLESASGARRHAGELRVRRCGPELSLRHHRAGSRVSRAFDGAQGTRAHVGRFCRRYRPHAQPVRASRHYRSFQRTDYPHP